MLGFLLGEALRDLRRAGRVALTAVVLITLSLVALGGFWLLSANLGRAVSEWKDRVRVILYLRREPTSVEQVVLLERVKGLLTVAGAGYISKAEALTSLKRMLGKDATVADNLPSNPLPASIEVTPTSGAATPDGARVLITRLGTLPEVEEVEGSVEWAERLSDWQRLLVLIGLGLGATLALMLGASALPAGAQPKREDPVQAGKRKLQETQNQLKQEREKAAEARRRETSLLAEIEDTERRLAQKQRDVARLDDRIKRAQAEVAALRGDITRLESYRSEQEEFLARRLRTIYKIHAQGAVLPVILSGESPVQRAATIKHLGSLAALDARMIQEYRVTSDRLADRKEREEARRNELASLRAEAKKEQAEVDREAAKRRQLLAKVRDERADHERMVGELSERARRHEAFIRDRQA